MLGLPGLCGHCRCGQIDGRSGHVGGRGRGRCGAGRRRTEARRSAEQPLAEGAGRQPGPLLEGAEEARVVGVAELLGDAGDALGGIAERPAGVDLAYLVDQLLVLPALGEQPATEGARAAVQGLGSGGRGPTKLISPLITFHSSGSSSRLVLRKALPNEVKRSSSSKGLPCVSTSSLIERNFIISNGLPCRPGRI